MSCWAEHVREYIHSNSIKDSQEEQLDPGETDPEEEDDYCSVNEEIDDDRLP